MKMKQIGARIRVLREKQGLTQQELADRLQVTRQTVSNYEIGRSQPDLEMLEQLANVLNVDVAVLLGNGQTSVRVPVRFKLEQIRSGERFPWGAIIAFLLVMPFVCILWAAFVGSMGLYTMALGMVLPFFWPALSLFTLIGVDFLLEKQGKALRWRLRLVAVVLMLLFLFGMAVWQVSADMTRARYYDFETFTGVVVAITEAPEGYGFDPYAKYHFVIYNKLSGAMIFDTEPTEKDVIYFTYLQDYYPWHMHTDPIELGDEVTVTALYPASANIYEEYVFPAVAIKNRGKQGYMPEWLKVWLQEQTQK